MKHVASISTTKPASAETLLEWTQKGVIFNSFINGLSTLAETKVTLED